MNDRKKLFNRFLKEKGIYKLYMENFKNFSRWDNYDSYMNYVEEVGYPIEISHAFPWPRVNNSIWHDFSVEWVKLYLYYLKNMKLKDYIKDRLKLYVYFFNKINMPIDIFIKKIKNNGYESIDDLIISNFLYNKSNNIHKGKNINELEFLIRRNTMEIDLNFFCDLAVKWASISM